MPPSPTITYTSPGKRRRSAGSTSSTRRCPLFGASRETVSRTRAPSSPSSLRACSPASRSGPNALCVDARVDELHLRGGDAQLEQAAPGVLAVGGEPRRAVEAVAPAHAPAPEAPAAPPLVAQVVHRDHGGHPGRGALRTTPDSAPEPPDTNATSGRQRAQELGDAGDGDAAARPREGLAVDRERLRGIRFRHAGASASPR